MLAYVVDPAARGGALIERVAPSPGPGEVLLRVEACGLCRTDLHILEGALVPPGPVVLGHQIVGQVIAAGDGADPGLVGQRVGVPWLAGSCGICAACVAGRENLCLYGFGAAAHLLTQVARWQGRRVHAFTRPGDAERQEYARSLGAVWAGGSPDVDADVDADVPFDGALDLSATFVLDLDGDRGDRPRLVDVRDKGGAQVQGAVEDNVGDNVDVERLWGFYAAPTRGRPRTASA